MTLPSPQHPRLARRWIEFRWWLWGWATTIAWRICPDKKAQDWVARVGLENAKRVIEQGTPRK